MDPLSITASCIAVTGAGGAAVKGLQKLRDLTKLPDALLSIINEIADLTLVVQDIRSSFHLHQASANISPASVAVIDQLLDRAQATLLELDQVINYRLLSVPGRNGATTFSRIAWILEEQRVLRLQASLRATRLDLAARFAALSFTRTLQLEVRLQELSLRMQTLQDSHLSESQYTRNTQTEAIGRLFTQIHSLEESQSRTYGALNVLRSDIATTRQITHQSFEPQDNLSSNTQQGERLSGINPIPRRHQAVVGLKVQQLTIAECRRSCPCQCHMRKQWRSYQLFDRILGNLFVGYSRPPNVALKCDLESCGRQTRSLVTVIYAFPQWLLRQVLSAVLISSRRNGIVVSLKTLRPRSSSDVFWDYIVQGDVDRVKTLFDRGEASPFDIGARTQIDPLRYAVTALQPEMCRFLLHSGADPNMAVGRHESAAALAWRRIFANNGTPETLRLFRQLFNDSNPSNESDFTTLHRIVLGLDHRDLTIFSQTCSPTTIDQRDVFGYTSLHWAAMRGDSSMVEMLLRLGADPHIRATQGSATALYFAAGRGNFRIIDLLLKYGADANSCDLLQSTPLMRMFMPPAQPDRSCVKRLVDGGAMIHAQDFQGATALLFAAQNGHKLGIEMLLRCGATVDIPTIDGETALTVAIQTNRHTAITPLLAHGASLRQHSVSGRSLLHEAAEHGDQETLRLLTSARIRGVKIGHKSSAGTTAWDLARKRVDVTPEWRDAFVDLIASVNESMPEPPPSRAKVSNKFSMPGMRLSDMIRAAEDRIWAGAEYTYEFASRLPRLLSALLVSCLAFLWYMMKT